jgi:hypothetical protein
MVMRIEPEIGSCSVVLLGHFNPLIFSPLWFARNELVTEAQAEEATVSVIHPEVTVLKVGKTQIQVEATRFSAETAEAPWIDLCDFVGRTFGEFLLHTPINQMGINRLVHFSVGDEETRNRIGRRLAPLESWGDWGAEIDAAQPPSRGSRGGCINVTMIQLKPKTGQLTGHVQATVQPSGRIKANAGIFMNVNDHYNSGPLESTVGCEHIITELSKNFDESIQKAERIIDQIMSLKDHQ